MGCSRVLIYNAQFSCCCIIYGTLTQKKSVTWVELSFTPKIQVKIKLTEEFNGLFGIFGPNIDEKFKEIHNFQHIHVKFVYKTSLYGPSVSRKYKKWVFGLYLGSQKWELQLFAVLRFLFKFAHLKSANKIRISKNPD